MEVDFIIVRQGGADMIMTTKCSAARWNPTKRVWAVVSGRGYCVAEVMGFYSKSFALRIAKAFNQRERIL